MRKGTPILFMIYWIGAFGLVITAGFFPGVVDNLAEPVKTRPMSFQDMVNFYGINFLAMFILMEILWYKKRKLLNKIKENKNV